MGLFALMFFCYSFVHQGWFYSATPVSRLDLLHAIYQNGTVQIDAFHRNTSDKAVFNGHYYSDKAPGTVAVALPALIAAATVLELSGIHIDSKTGWLASSWIACAFSIGIITALGGVAMFAWLLYFVPPHSSLITTLAIFLGSLPFPYATMMFSHTMVIGLICVGLSAVSFGIYQGYPLETANCDAMGRPGMTN